MWRRPPRGWLRGASCLRRRRSAPFHYTQTLRAANIPRRSYGAASVELRVWRSCVLVAGVPWEFQTWCLPSIWAATECDELDGGGRGWPRVAGRHAERASTSRAHRHPGQEQPLHGGRRARQPRACGGPQGTTMVVGQWRTPLPARARVGRAHAGWRCCIVGGPVLVPASVVAWDREQRIVCARKFNTWFVAALVDDRLRQLLAQSSPRSACTRSFEGEASSPLFRLHLVPFVVFLPHVSFQSFGSAWYP